jgi:Cu/Ag efflux pump CusA
MWLATIVSAAATCLLLVVGVWAARTLPVDALPDVSPVQVSVPP